MSLTEIILLFYVLPMVIVGVGLYFNEGIRTIGDWLDNCDLVFIPVLNNVACFTMFCIILKDNLRMGERWKKFRNLKIKKDKNETI